MISPGRISLLDPMGDTILTAMYEYPSDRKDILKKWRARCGPIFDFYTKSIILPEQSAYRVMNDGTNYAPGKLIKQIQDHHRPVDLYRNGVLVGTFKSRTLAAFYIGCSISSVTRMIQNKEKIIKGFNARPASSDNVTT